MKPGGSLFVSVPYGAPDDFGWLRVFSAESLEALIAAFEPESVTRTYFRYDLEGWHHAERRGLRRAALPRPLQLQRPRPRPGRGGAGGGLRGAAQAGAVAPERYSRSEISGASRLKNHRPSANATAMIPSGISSRTAPPM